MTNLLNKKLCLITSLKVQNNVQWGGGFISSN